jgi:hypothetical protein
MSIEPILLLLGGAGGGRGTGWPNTLGCGGAALESGVNSAAAAAAPGRADARTGEKSDACAGFCIGGYGEEAPPIDAGRRG